MPPSVRPGIWLSVHAPAGLPCGRSAWRRLAPVRIRRSIRSPPSARGGADSPRRSRSMWSYDHTALDRLTPRCFVGDHLLRRVRGSHWSGGGVSLLFQSRRSPVPGFPRSPARRWGDVPRVRACWHVRADGHESSAARRGGRALSASCIYVSEAKRCSVVTAVDENGRTIKRLHVHPFVCEKHAVQTATCRWELPNT